MGTIHLHGAAKGYVEIVPERPLINYARVPVAAPAELERFMEDLEPRLAEVLVPTLVVQGNEDSVVNSEGTALLYTIASERNRSSICPSTSVAMEFLLEKARKRFMRRLRHLLINCDLRGIMKCSRTGTKALLSIALVVIILAVYMQAGNQRVPEFR